MILRLLTLWVLVSVSVAQAQQTPTQTIIRDGVGDTTQQNVTNGNSHVNIGRINNVVPLMGAGTTGTGSPRVTEASDSQLSQGVGATGDAAATAGGTGSINAKLRLLTDLVNQVLTELGQKTEPANTQAISAASLPLPTGAATAANQDGIIKDGSGDTTQANVVGGRLQVENYNANLAADNSTLSTSKVPVLPGTVSTSAPTWTNGNQSALSLQTDGSVRAAITNTPTVTANAGTNLNTSALLTTSAHDAAFGTAGSADAQVRTVQGIASMTPLLVNPGTATNFGVYAEDAAETAGANLSMAGSVRRDTAASSAGASGDNATINTDATGLLWARLADPCSALAKTYLPINISTATTTEITPSLAGASNHYYVCSINIGPVAGAQNLALVDDDTDNCASVTSGLAGGTTAGSGWNIAANGGLTMGNGLGSIARTGGTNRVLCLVSSAAVQTSGVITVVAAP